MTRPLPALLLVAVVGLCAGCTQRPHCSGDYQTDTSHPHHNGVYVIVEGPELEYVDWDLAVNLGDNARGNDWMTIMLYQSPSVCPWYSINIEFYFGQEGLLDNYESRSNFEYVDACVDGDQVRDRWHLDTEGTVSFVRANGEVTITFDNLIIENTDPLPAEPPGLSRIRLNGEYRASVYCLKTI